MKNTTAAAGVLREDAHQHAIDTARPLIAKGRVWAAIGAAVDATLTATLVAQPAIYDTWLEALPDQIRLGTIPAGICAELAAALAQHGADAQTVPLHVQRDHHDLITIGDAA